VIRALEETGIPIDFVGGTSIGAMMGAAVAAGLSDAERLQRIVEPIATRGRLLDVTLPILSLASATKISRLLSSQAGFGSLQIEDLPRPFFCVSADLSSADEVVHERGDLWRAIRASLSIPGVFPPVYERGRLLVDGAVLNNLPVDLMRVRVGSGTVIAVDLLPEMDRLESTPFEPELSGWRALGKRLRPSIGSYSVPTILDVMSRSNALAGVRAQRDVLATTRVDLYLRPPMFQLGSFDFKAALPLIELAYHDTMSVLETHDWERRARVTSPGS
jgi:predicted acylesterase/phospholipase RssA